MALDESYAFTFDDTFTGLVPKYHKESPGFLPVKTSGGWHWNKEYYCVMNIKQEDLYLNDISVVLGKSGEYRLCEEDFIMLKLQGLFR